jgi:NADPH:quinone reductase-like Zn-dependent oxidoreductase
MPTIPQTMRAAALDRFGGPDVLSIHMLPVPTINAREVLIAVDTAGVGIWDAKMRAGPGRGRPHTPLVLGADGSGTVVAVGSGVRRLAKGDRVYAYSYANPKGGFYAEYVAVAGSKVAPTPQGYDLEHAGAIPTSALTALQGIDDALHVAPGQRVIVHGASGSVGSLALQFAKQRGARVLATATGADGLAFVTRLGADVAVDGKSDGLAPAARQFAPHAILALIGGDALDRCIDALHVDDPNGRPRVAYPNGIAPPPKRRRGIEMIPYDAVPGVRQFDRLARAMESAPLSIPIAASYPLADAAAAHERIDAGHVLGKIVLRV